MDNWDDRRFFLAVAREGSINKAAKKLAVNRTTVLRRITAFEEKLGVRLFERLPNGYFTTAAGDEMKRAAEQVEAVINDADRRLAGRDTRLSGTIQVSISGALTTSVLMEDLAQFSRSHPDIRLEILNSFNMPDLARREADVAIRISNDPPEDLVGRRILKIARAAYVSRELLPGRDGKLKSSTGWIGWSLGPSSLQWVEDSDFPDLPVTAIITDPYATIEALRAGMGMSVLPCFMGDLEPDLYRMPPGRIMLMTDLWILTHKDLRNTARIRKFTTFIATALLRHRDLLEGKCARELP